ncbi:MAG: DUF4292 domain-containing protein [Ignavibacteria bacterium]|nr:DUF4292 domain-containing protein [Ignavibacteria bacterium]
MHNKFIVSAILLSFVALFYITGCAPAVQQETTYEKLSSERLINKLEANRRKVKTFEGTGTIAVKTSTFDNSASFKVILHKPDSIYINIYGPFGIDLAQILVTKSDFTFLESLNNTVYTGALNDNVLKEIFKIDLPLPQLIDAFTGAVNLSEHLYKEPTFFDIVQDKYLLTYIDSLQSTSTRYSIDVRDLCTVSAKHEDLKGNSLLEAEYKDFIFVEALSIPKRTVVRRQSDGQMISIEYKNVSVNKKNSVIDFKIPDDADVIKW